MARNLSRVHCTEEDKVNCPFYFKNGACRYGDKCTRRHLKPSISQTLLFPRMYDSNPLAIAMAEGKLALTKVNESTTKRRCSWPSRSSRTSTPRSS